MTAFAIWAGGTLAGYTVLVIARSLAYELLSHPTVRKMANAADKFSGKEGGVLGKLIDKVL